jgi:hypothetical protein
MTPSDAYPMPRPTSLPGLWCALLVMLGALTSSCHRSSGGLLGSVAPSGLPTVAAKEVTHLTDRVGQGSGMRMEGDQLFWANRPRKEGSSGTIWRMKVPDGEPAVVVEGLRDGDTLFSVEGDRLFWFEKDAVTTDTNATLHAMTLPAGPSVVLATGEPVVRGIAVDAQNVYWVAAGHEGDKGTIRRIARSGGAIETLATGLINGAEIALDEDTVYWTDRGPPAPFGFGSTIYEHGMIAAVSKRGGEPRTLASGISQLTGHLVANGGTLYYETRGIGGGPGAVWEIRKAGTPQSLRPQRFSPDQFVIEDSLTASSDGLYWASYEPRPVGDTRGFPADTTRVAIWRRSEAGGDAKPLVSTDRTPYRGLGITAARVFFCAYTVYSVAK